MPCGCVAGLYETYRDEIVTIIDAHGAGGGHPGHLAGDVLASRMAPSTSRLDTRSPHE